MHLLSDPTDRRIALPGWKRALDIGCCLAALPVFALVTIVAAVITRLCAPGPIFFRQERLGLNGRKFQLFKFRTMHVSASVAVHQAHFAQLMKSNAPMQKMDARGDNRLIPGGWWLRVTGLDELPQIINVLRGDMSIVGPRPCIQYEFDQYTPAQRERLRSAPGLTGLWQVSGKNRTTFEEMIALDIAYASRRSLACDLAIIFKTPTALVLQVLDTRRARRTAAVTAAVPAAADVAPTVAPAPATPALSTGLVETVVDPALAWTATAAPRRSSWTSAPAREVAVGRGLVAATAQPMTLDRFAGSLTSARTIEHPERN